MANYKDTSSANDVLLSDEVISSPRLRGKKISPVLSFYKTTEKSRECRECAAAFNLTTSTSSLARHLMKHGIFQKNQAVSRPKISEESKHIIDNAIGTWILDEAQSWRILGLILYFQFHSYIPLMTSFACILILERFFFLLVIVQLRFVVYLSIPEFSHYFQLATFSTVDPNFSQYLHNY
jgi:hypothetical protein